MERKSNNTGCSFVRSNLFSYQERLLPDRDVKEFEEHLHSCAECSGIVSGFQSVTSLIDAKKSEEPNPFIQTRIVRRIESEVEAETGTSKPVFQLLLRPVTVSLLLLVAMIIGFSVVMSRETKLYADKNHQVDLKVMKSGLNIPDFINEDKIVLTNY
jgi:hypothetical protein